MIGCRAPIEPAAAKPTAGASLPSARCCALPGRHQGWLLEEQRKVADVAERGSTPPSAYATSMNQMEFGWRVSTPTPSTSTVTVDAASSSRSTRCPHGPGASVRCRLSSVPVRPIVTDGPTAAPSQAISQAGPSCPTPPGRRQRRVGRPVRAGKRCRRRFVGPVREQAGDRRPFRRQGGCRHRGDLHRLEHGGVEQPCMGQRLLMRLDDDLRSIDSTSPARTPQQHADEPLLCDHRQMSIDLDGVDGVDHPVGESQPARNSSRSLTSGTPYAIRPASDVEPRDRRRSPARTTSRASPSRTNTTVDEGPCCSWSPSSA